MKTVRAYQRRTALLTSSVAFAALLCGASPALAVPFLGPAESFMVMGPSVVVNTGRNMSKDDRTDFGSLDRIGGGTASALEPASMLIFTGGLISLLGFMGVNRRVSHRIED